MKKQFSFFFILCSFFLKAQETFDDLQNLNGTKIENTIKFNYIPVDIKPGELGKEEMPMIAVGIHYDFPLNKHFYAGVGMFAAVKGDQGGLFTLGAELGFQQKIYKNLYFDTDFHFGGGGGYRYLVKDGAFINTNIGLKLKTQKVDFGLQYSYFNFYNGYIKSNSVSAFVSIPSTFLFSDYNQANKRFTTKTRDKKHFWNRQATKNAQSLRFDHFIPTGDTKDQWYEPITNTLYTLGFEYDQYLNRQIYSYIHLDAIYKGLKSGFMDLFVGVGYEPIQTKSFKVFTKFGIGSSGGRVEREGGFTIYPSLGIEHKIYKQFSLALHGGYIMAPFGNFEAYTVGYSIKYNTFNNGIHHPELNKNPIVKTRGVRFSIQNQTYLAAASTITKSYDLQLIAVQINYDLSQQFYITGQAAFAYEGEAGGYADGMLGLGFYSPKMLYDKIEFTLEFLVGAAGGAHIDTGAGLAIKPKFGINYCINNKIYIISSYGKIIAPYGNLNSTNINFGLSFNFSKLQIQD
tara:strand:- start:1284 stop:2831 length:1548 start_codon:yes stop_codon:yes gene_type:complete